MLHLHDINENLKIKQFEIFKPYGYTPKDVIDEIIEKTRSKKATFNGRLDPMACGAMRVYLDEACQQSKFDMSCGKIYRFKMGLGLASSSCDLLGDPYFIPTHEKSMPPNVELNIGSFLTTLQQGYVQTLPPLSSYRVSNKDGITQPLWWWDKNNRLNEIAIPSFDRKITDFKLDSVSRVLLTDIAKTAIERISLISSKHTYNQKEIVEKWRDMLNRSYEEITVCEMRVSVSSGFYVRKLVEDIGNHLGIKTITIEIERLAYLS